MKTTREKRSKALAEMVELAEDVARETESAMVCKLARMVGVLCVIVREGLDEASQPSGEEKPCK